MIMKLIRTLEINNEIIVRFFANDSWTEKTIGGKFCAELQTANNTMVGFQGESLYETETKVSNYIFN